VRASALRDIAGSHSKEDILSETAGLGSAPFLDKLQSFSMSILATPPVPFHCDICASAFTFDLAACDEEISSRSPTWVPVR
jgi:hypothetical protein